MKYRTIFVILFFPLISKSQDFLLPFDSAAKKITYTDTVRNLNRGAADLYSASKIFIKDEFENRSKKYHRGIYDPSQKMITRVFDDQTQKVVARGNIVYFILQWGSAEESTNIISYKLTIECYEGFYIYTFTDFIDSDWTNQLGLNVQGGDFDKDDPGKIPTKSWMKIKKQVDKEIKEIILSLKKTMVS